MGGTLQWPFEEWGATAVFAGHSHDYERIIRHDDGDGVDMPYFVTGLGGKCINEINLGSLVSGSEAQYDDDFGTILVQASDSTISFQFYSVEGGGTLIDTYTIDVDGADPSTAGGDDAIDGSSDDDFINGLSGDDVITGAGGNDTLIGGDGDDLFVFNQGDGEDVVADFKGGAGTDDRLDVSALGFANFDAIMNSTSNIGADVLIDLGNGDQVTLIGVQKSELHDDDFVLS